MRYDAVILGAGPDGLAAATRLARAGLKTIVLERAAVPGGICATRAFHPGFHASPFADELPPIPVGVFWSLDLARHGAIFCAPSAQALAGESGATLVENALAGFAERIQMRIARELSRSDAEADKLLAARRWFSWPKPFRMAALDEWESRSALDVIGDLPAEAGAAILARAFSGRAADPALRGTASHLLNAASTGMVAGGLAVLGEALASAAREAGADISCGVEAAGIQMEKERVRAVTLADGTVIEAQAVLSTFDLKRTILSLFQWSDLPPPVVKRAADFRMSGSTARMLVALDALPEGDAQLRRATVHAACSPADYAKAFAAWRQGIVPDNPPATLRMVSAIDPRLAPAGKATLTVTLGCIPHRLFDGDWTAERREALKSHVLSLVDAVFPGAAEHVVASELLLPSDFEEMLGCTNGDLLGGEIAPDQMFAARCWPEWPRTPVHGLYLGGPSSAIGPVATAASGWIAAKALVVDHRAGRLA